MKAGSGAYFIAATIGAMALTCCWLVRAVAATAAAPATKFVSKQYHYAIVLPGSAEDWSPTYAVTSWSVGVVTGGGPAFDTFLYLGNQRQYIVAARRPPTGGSTLTKWTAFVIAHRPSAECSSKVSEAGSTLDGAAARAMSWSCSDGYFAYAITALHHGLGYFMIVATPQVVSHTSDQRAFEAARRSFRFTTG